MINRFTNDLIKDIKINVPVKHFKYYDEQIIFNEGDKIPYVGIVEKGGVIIKSSTIDGYEFEIMSVGPGMVFGDMLALSDKNVLPGTIYTLRNTEIIYISKNNFKLFLETNKEFLSRYLKYISNMNIEKTYKIKLLGQPSIREKIFFFLKEEIKKTGSNTVKLHMSKEELASMMSLNRPSLSRELMRMRDEGLIEYDRNSITLLA